MRTLEHRIPPPLVALVFALSIWGLSVTAPVMQLNTGLRLILAGLFILAGIGFGVAGSISFKVAKTTVNPLSPQNTSCLVTTGIYRISRNPMYVGLAMLLIAWCIYLDTLWGMVSVILCMLYLQRFQIIPEENILLGLFGQEYKDYMQKVRRWL